MLNIRSSHSLLLVRAVRWCRATAVASLVVLLASPAIAQFDRTGASQVGSIPNQAEASATNLPGGAPSSPPAQTQAGGPLQLRQSDLEGHTQRPRNEDTESAAIAPAYVPSEFETYVDNQATLGPNIHIRRFGSSLLTDATRSNALEPLPSIPGSYIIKPGDEVSVTIWGSVDADLRVIVDRSGLITVPRVGAINVGGLKYSELTPTISNRVGQLFRDYHLVASLGQVRPIRVFITGFVQHPGGTTMSGLSTVLHAVMRAGGPSHAGSFRDVRLTRDGQKIATFDLYDLLLRGDRAADQLLQPDDVIFIGPVGTQVAAIGSVNQPAVFELKPNETLADLLAMAGGFTPVADSSRVSIQRLADRKTGHVAMLPLPAHLGDSLSTGDVIWAFSTVSAAIPQYRQNARVHIDGEVVNPGDYLMPPGSQISEVIREAGGLTPGAYPFGAELRRRSVLVAQQANYDRALRELETNMAKATATQHVSTNEEAAARAASSTSNALLLERLREIKPNGRIVLEVSPDDRTLPEMALEDGDSLHIPARVTSVGVFGSVFNTGSYVFKPNRTTGDYLHLAGGPTRGADKKSMFLIRANGSVVSAQEGSSFWHSGNEFSSATVLPGDTIFVPEEMDKSTLVQDAKDWTQVLYQFGLGVAGLKILGF